MISKANVIVVPWQTSLQWIIAMCLIVSGLPMLRHGINNSSDALNYGFAQACIALQNALQVGKKEAVRRK